MQPLITSTRFSTWISRYFQDSPQNNRSQRTFELVPRSLRRTRLAPATRIYCRRGTAWITEDGSEKDLIIRQGEILCFHQETTILIEALTSAALEISEAPHQQPQKRRGPRNSSSPTAG